MHTGTEKLKTSALDEWAVMFAKTDQTLPRNVIKFSHRKRQRYSIDVMAENVVDGVVLIEACIPVAALHALKVFVRVILPRKWMLGQGNFKT
jgi:hypothetical protein